MTSLPSHIGNFEVLRQLGSGGMATVYLGRDPELGRQVAIKVVREEISDQEVLDRFLREARAAAALRHPNIITVYASGEHNHQPYMAIEFVDGESLAEIIRSKRTIPLSDKISYLEQICAGLAFAHRAGIVHRDIKPANIMIDREGVVRILDFGIARIKGSAMTQDGSLMGSLNYMSPEQMLGRPVDHRSDIFSTGSVAYELLSYQQAFKGGLNDGLLQRLPYEDPPPLDEIYPGLPVALEQVVMRALEKAPEKRFQDLTEMRTAILGGQETAQPATDRTMLMRQPEPAEISPPEPTLNVVTGAARFDETTVTSTTHARKAGTGSSSGSTEAPSPATESSPKTGAPAASPLKLKNEAAGGARPIAMAARPSTQARIAQERPRDTPRAAALDASRSQASERAPSKRWGLMVAAGALIAAAVVAIPWLTTEPPDPASLERPGIEAAMERFRTAYRNRDLQGVREVFPTLPPETELVMQRSFDDCLVYEVIFTDLRIEMSPTDAALAQADLRSAHTCTPVSGARQTTAEHHDLFTLRKSGNTWHIDGATEAPIPSVDGTQ